MPAIPLGDFPKRFQPNWRHLNAQPCEVRARAAAPNFEVAGIANPNLLSMPNAR
jgi:hypothetical protein